MMAKNIAHFWPKVVQVVPTDTFGVYAYFNDGSVHFFDAKPLLKPSTVFEPLCELQNFKSKLAVINNTVGWYMAGERNARNCVDIDPFTIFETPAVADPLAEKTT